MLAQRVATAAAGIPIIIALVWVGGIWYAAVVAAALAAASIEFNHGRRDWLDPVSVLTALIVAGIAVGAYISRNDRWVWWAWLGAGIAIPPLAVLLSPTSSDDLIEDVVWIIGGVMYVGFLGGFIVLLRTVDDGREWAYLALLTTFAADTGAYFTGRAIGRHALAPSISPKKTVEGFVGGWAFGFAVAIVLNFVFDLGATPPQIVLLALALPVAAAAGDLAESAIKRVMGIKDASDLIPGHGGVLDRLDSILFTFAVTYAFVQIVIA